MEHFFDDVNRQMDEAMTLLVAGNVRGANMALNHAFQRLVDLGNDSGIDLQWVKELFFGD